MQEKRKENFKLFLVGSDGSDWSDWSEVLLRGWVLGLVGRVGGPLEEGGVSDWSDWSDGSEVLLRGWVLGLVGRV